jgi:hypothetical protein
MIHKDVVILAEQNRCSAKITILKISLKAGLISSYLIQQPDVVWLGDLTIAEMKQDELSLTP